MSEEDLAIWLARRRLLELAATSAAGGAIPPAASAAGAACASSFSRQPRPRLCKLDLRSGK